MDASKNRLNLFIRLETIQAFLQSHVPENLEFQKVFEDCAFTVDIIDAPQRLFYHSGSETVELKLDRRGSLYMVEEKDSLNEAHMILDQEGAVRGNAPEELQNVMQIYLMFCLNMSVRLREQSLLEKYADLNPERQGLLVEEVNGQLEMNPVSGNERPDLACKMFSGEVKMMRPYNEDMMRGVLLDAMPLERKVAAAEAGDIGMMKHLFDFYMGNHVSPHNDLMDNMKKMQKLMKALSGEGSDEPEEDEEEDEEENTRNPEKAFYWLKKLAESGDAEAMDELSAFYLKAFGTERDLEKSADWEKKAIENGFEVDPSMEQVLQTAREEKEKAETGDSGAQANYARILSVFAQYRTDLGSEADEKEAFQWAQKAASKADPDGLFTLASFYENGTGILKDETKAFRLLERAANKGHAASQARLGQMYFQGTGTEENPEAAFEWSKKAAEAGDSNGMSNLAACYLMGKGVGKDMGKAVEWLQKAAELGDDGAKGLLEKLGAPLKPQQEERQPQTVAEAEQMAEQGSVKAMKILANYYINRPGGREDLYEAHKWAKMAADQGDEDAKQLCEQLENHFNGETISFEEAKEGAENGDPGAQKILADYYATGYKTDRDLVKALYWMKKAAASGDQRFAEHAQSFVDAFTEIEPVVEAAKQGDIHALARLAEKYVGIFQNYPEYNQEQGQKDTFQLAEKSAEGGDPLGMFILGMCYENGYGIESNREKAFDLYRKSAEAGNPRGELGLSQCYLTGIGTQIDADLSMEWLKKAEAHGNPEVEQVKDLYRQLMPLMAVDKLGDGEKSGGPDPVQGVKLMRHAAELGSADAQGYLGIMYLKGDHVEPDLESGIIWLRKAVENGNQQAAQALEHNDRPQMYYNAAILETKRKDRPIDQAKVLRLLKTAAEGGITDAMGLLGTYLTLGLGGELDYEKGIEWMQKAADLGNENVARTLKDQNSPQKLFLATMAAFANNRNKGLTDHSKAYQLLERAADAGSPEAFNLLGVLYAAPEETMSMFGKIGEQDYEKACAYFNKALELKPELQQAENNLKKISDLREAEETGREPDQSLKWTIALGKKSGSPT